MSPVSPVSLVPDMPDMPDMSNVQYVHVRFAPFQVDHGVRFAPFQVDHGPMINTVPWPTTTPGRLTSHNGLSATLSA